MKRLSLDLPRLLCLLTLPLGLGAGVALLPTTAKAEAASIINNSYYATPGDIGLTQLLRNNEEALLGKAQKDLATRLPHRLKYPIADFGYFPSRWPNHPQARQGMFETARLLNRPQLVERYAKAAIEVAPDAAPTYVVIGAYLMRQGQLKQAETLLTRAAELDPNSLNADYNLGLLHSQTQRLDLANGHAQKAHALGHPMPGMRKRLEAAGAWKPLPPKSEPATPATPPASGSATPPAATAPVRAPQ